VLPKVAGHTENT